MRGDRGEGKADEGARALGDAEASGENHDGGAAQHDVAALSREAHARAATGVGLEGPGLESLGGGVGKFSCKKVEWPRQHDLGKVKNTNNRSKRNSEPLSRVSQDTGTIGCFG